MTDKATLRHEALKFRESMALSVEDFEAAAALFAECISVPAGAAVALYWPKGREFDVRPLIDDLLNKKITCALPVMQKDSKELQFARWDESVPLVEGPFGIMQPGGDPQWVEPAIVVVPLLAFDRHGHRLGHGGGYYDATLAALRARKTIVAVGIGYAEQAVLFKLPADEHDQKLDWVITPQKAQNFSKG